ncbi:uncharacterized protein I303_105771 [Kwoniella dejecticola CBS 10117]|uniref:Uncharacterized protein n=1 Tax=Kwoniella dejecticola CBS 10117 TaxID=1296121 RepID=A0A1A6A0E2_9TREE|nr:uncharacterized protein I303_05793 [Kwoniella dejecticola CBS 10117]OBR83513.1 hypothetical protein I303_05793 [Kwoniella dejecticola CBS 10117]
MIQPATTNPVDIFDLERAQDALRHQAEDFETTIRNLRVENRYVRTKNQELTALLDCQSTITPIEIARAPDKTQSSHEADSSFLAGPKQDDRLIGVKEHDDFETEGNLDKIIEQTVAHLTRRKADLETELVHLQADAAHGMFGIKYAESDSANAEYAVDQAICIRAEHLETVQASLSVIEQSRVKIKELKSGNQDLKAQLEQLAEFNAQLVAMADEHDDLSSKDRDNRKRERWGRYSPEIVFKKDAQQSDQDGDNGDDGWEKRW